MSPSAAVQTRMGAQQRGMGETCSVSLRGEAWRRPAVSTSATEHGDDLQCLPQWQSMRETCRVNLGGRAWGRPAVSPSAARHVGVSPSAAKYRGDLPHRLGMGEMPLSSVAAHVRESSPQYQLLHARPALSPLPKYNHLVGAKLVSGYGLIYMYRNLKNMQCLYIGWSHYQIFSYIYILVVYRIFSNYSDSTRRK